MANMRPLLFLALAAAPLGGQAQQATGCMAPESKQLDFWVGDWDLTYGDGGKGRSRITKILDGCVVLEEFEGAPGVKLNGRSLSVFDRPSGKWKQTWVDDSGAYLDFAGGREGDTMVLAREVQRGGKSLRQRMVYSDIAADSLTWRWQRSDDGGASWKTLWEIRYRRIK
jgi:hypothetical protein